MNETDDLIHRALTEEDRALLARHGEPGYIRQALGLFRGPEGWVGMLAYVTALVAFAGFAYAFWQLWMATDAVAAVRWGVVALLAFQYSAMMKSVMGTRVEANRVLRELKRVELRVALAQDARPGGVA
ncbi:hypothetical protein QFW80_10275 [Luteimonas sp. M1R5S18]|jgi:hypothetical protein|uniref:Uncharacterized protein n=1 Tax=Luteimonas rhizosphaericola TaxID=3042024 RepID=A0ABT6JJN5_9GAMM|nr:DUF6768 family protein [Luteimonas rhizosphaericola]MDH5830899.1 hypothetical protein [Luteimonas rhizosphaericola]